MRLSIATLLPLALAQFTYDNATMQTVDLAPGFSFSWDWISDSVAFTLNLGAPVYANFDWVGVGLSVGQVTSMKGADIYTVVKANGNYYLSDRMGVGPTYPPSDESQGGTNDLRLLDFMDDGFNVTISFRRPLDSGDSNDLTILPNQEYSVLYAWGSADGEMVNYHGPTQRGFKAVNFTAAPPVLASAFSLALALWLLVA